MSTPVFSATGVPRSFKPQKRNPLNHCCLMNGGLISSQFPPGTSTGARCSAAPNTRRCASPALTATSKVGQQMGQEGPNPLRGFWDTFLSPLGANGRCRVRPVSTYEDSRIRGCEVSPTVPATLHRTRCRLCSRTAPTNLLLNLRQVLPSLLARLD